MMPKEILITIILAIIQIPIGIIGGTMPQQRSKVPPISSAVSIVLTLGLLVLYWQEKIPQDLVLYGAIALTAVAVIILIVYILRTKQSKNIGIEPDVGKMIADDKTASLLALPDALQALGELDIELANKLGRIKRSKTKLKSILSRLQKDWEIKPSKTYKNLSEQAIRDARDIVNQTVKKMGLSYTSVNEETMMFMLHITGVLDDENVGISAKREKDNRYKLVIKLQAKVATQELNNAISAYLWYSLGINSILLFISYFPTESARLLMQVFGHTSTELRAEREQTLRFLLTNVSELVEKELYGKK